ncbi:quinone oxidoreductase family protein [Kitasatospora sp. NPDC058406]|uniref:quinone oxidoreductase family protein n=1 Tax=Kitasatospora sp. NPDC058406 TaxID=3346483 RepID=UPI00365F8ADB
MKAIRVHAHGGPEQLRVDDDVPVTEPADGEIRIRTEVIGVNYVDVYHRQGVFPVPLPFVPGMDAVGTVDAVGPGVTEVAVGDRVAYGEVPGAYAEFVTVPVRLVAAVPDGLDSGRAAAAMLQGLTAHYLAHDSHPIAKGQVVVVHAAAGGVGQFLVQFAKRAGAHVIGTVSTDEKAELIAGLGADTVVRYDRENFREVVHRVTDGVGADAVYDSVGKVTFLDSLDSLRPRGTLVVYGRASGTPDPIDPFLLVQKGSLRLTWPSLTHHVRTREEFTTRTGDLFSGLIDGSLRARIDREYDFADAPAAHAQLERRESLGKILLRHP